MNAGNNVTGFTVLNNSVVTVNSDVLSTPKENGRSNSISEGTIKDMTVSDVSEDVVMGGKEEIKDGDKDKNDEEEGENVIEGGGAGEGAVAIDGGNQETVQVDTANDTIEVNGKNEVGEKEKEGIEEIEERDESNPKEGEGEEEGGSHKKRKRSESCVDDTITLPVIEKELIDEERVTDTNDTVLTSSTESVVSAPDSDNKVEVNDALVATKKDENKVEKSKAEIDRSKSIAIVSAPLPVVRSFPVRQSALTDR